MDIVVTNGAITRASPPTNQHPVLTGRMRFLSPSQQCQSTEGRKNIIDVLITVKVWIEI